MSGATQLLVEGLAVMGWASLIFLFAVVWSLFRPRT